MSSHHIVRDNQEPALLIETVAEQELLNQLLEWSPIVVVTDKVLTEILLTGIKIDAAYIHTDALASTGQMLKEKFMEIDIISYSDYNWQKDIFPYLIAKNVKIINLMTNASPEYNNNIATIYFNGNSRMFYVKNEFKKWYAEKNIVEVYKEPGMQINSDFDCSDKGNKLELNVLKAGFLHIVTEEPVLIKEVIQT